MKRMEGFFEEAASLLLSAYLFIMFCMFPFYMRSGYMEIGKDKYDFFKAITAGGFCLIVPFAVLCMVFHGIRVRKEKGGKEEIPEDEEWEEVQEPRAGWRGKLSGTDMAVLAYGGCVILSYIGSEYKKTALYGEKGWYMGALVQLVFVFSYFLVSRFWEYEEKMLLAFMAAAGAVFTLGVLNRFSVFPIAVQGANSSFISTLGNINWYSGYWSVLFPIGMILYWKAEEIWLRIPALLYTAVGIATGVSQGSNSAFIVFAGIYVFLFCISFQSVDAMKRFARLAILFCAVCQGLRLWRLWWPAAFDYYGGTLSDWITLSRVTLAGLGVLLVFYGLLCFAGRRKDFEMGRFKIFRQLLVLSVVIVTGVYLMLLYLNSRVKGGIRFLGGFSVLTFGRQWGSARGATWSAAMQVYRSMPQFKKLIGVGPDCLASFLYANLSDLSELLDRQFDGARLTNAHNEWLNMLVNVGILGFISYGGIFVSAVVRFLYYGEKVCRGKGKYLCIFAFSAFAYTIHNVVSFQQILSTPFVFLVLGMGECLLRGETDS